MRLKTPYFPVIAGLLACAPSGPLLADQLRIENILGGDSVVVMMASRGPGGCRNGQVLRTTGNLPVGNVLAAAGCNSEIAVFAEQNAMTLITPVTTWTDSDGDVNTVTMQPIIDVPVSVWLARTGEDAPAETRERALVEVANANFIYRRNKVGVHFVATVHDVSDDATAKIGNSCNTIGAIRDSVWYTPKTLNIYYVNDVISPPELFPLPTNVPGLNCDRFGDGKIKGDANITFIGKSADLATLAHEIGHAFGLRPGNAGGHTNGLWGFDERNVMWGHGGAQRDRFTLGQVFRMNTQVDEWGGSMLIANGLRPGPGRACPPQFNSDRCPPLALDWSRPQEEE
jgi:hypothetical protein